MKLLVEAERDGRLSEREAASVRRHRATCTSCAALAADLEHIGATLQVAPRSPLEVQRGRLRLLRDAARPRRLPRPAPRRALAAAAVLAVAAGAWMLETSIRPQRQPPAVAHLPAIPRPAPARIETRIDPDPDTRFTRSAMAGVEVVTLETGALTLSVRPLAATERFLVRTGDAEVEVRGTLFRVEAAANQLRSVQVTEGRVEVRFRGRTSTLAGGDAWTPPLDTEAESARGRAPPKPPLSSAPASAVTTRAEEASKAFREGVSLVDRGDYDAATQRLRAFSEAHPSDDRAEDAAFLIVLSMQRAGRLSQAKAAARDYLARHPNGYRRAEVEAILRSP
jgi:hypothetical protein